ncbi:MAG: hypothetical protein AAGF81_07695 [Pseudomonadota bacterium]
MNLLGLDLTTFSLMGAAIMLAIGLVDYLVVSWALKQGEKQALRDGTVSDEKTAIYERVRRALAIACFIVFPLIGLLAGNFVLGSIF